MPIYYIAFEIENDENHLIQNQLISRFKYNEDTYISYKPILNNVLFVEYKDISNTLLQTVLKDFNESLKELTLSKKIKDSSKYKIKICISELCIATYISDNIEYIGDWMTKIFQKEIKDKFTCDDFKEQSSNHY